MPAVSQAQRKFILANPSKFGGKKTAFEEWIEPTKGVNLPEHVAKKPKAK